MQKGVIKQETIQAVSFFMVKASAQGRFYRDETISLFFIEHFLYNWAIRILANTQQFLR